VAGKRRFSMSDTFAGVRGRARTPQIVQGIKQADRAGLQGEAGRSHQIKLPHPRRPNIKTPLSPCAILKHSALRHEQAPGRAGCPGLSSDLVPVVHQSLLTPFADALCEYASGEKA